MQSVILSIVLGILVLMGVAFYMYMEQQSRLLRTRVVDVPGGLRFIAHDFSVEVQRADRQVLIQTKTGRLTLTPLTDGQAEAKHAPLDVVLPAPGLVIEVARVLVNDDGQTSERPTGLCSITFKASDALSHAAQNLPGGYSSVLTIDRVLDPVAVSFNGFASRIRIWVDKTNRRVNQEKVERLRLEQAAAQADEQEQLLAEARANRSSEDALTDTDREAVASAQIAKWRKTAGFTGSASEVNIDGEGRVAWFVDLADDGRITLHVDKRTIHTTLQGATIASMGGELEIGLRDDYWTEDEPELRIFRVLKGLPPGERRAWKERLELVRDSMKKKPTGKVNFTQTTASRHSDVRS
jgi:hypothetical protein